MNIGQYITKTFNFKLGSWDIAPTYWQAGAIVFLLFLLLFTLARVRYLYVHWNLSKTSISMIFWGFLLALILEGFLIISGRTLFTEVLGWKNAPKPLSTALDRGRAKLISVLGVTDEIPESVASETPTYQSVVSEFVNLSPEDKEVVRKFVCEPGD